MPNTFIVEREINYNNFSKCEELAEKQTTAHFLERNERRKVYKELGLLETKFLYGFIVDKNHPNGDEMHFINAHGIIYIMNCRTARLITILGARPGQIRRYFNALDMAITQEVRDLLNIAYDNVVNKGINQV